MSRPVRSLIAGSLIGAAIICLSFAAGDVAAEDSIALTAASAALFASGFGFMALERCGRSGERGRLVGYNRGAPGL